MRRKKKHLYIEDSSFISEVLNVKGTALFVSVAKSLTLKTPSKS